MDVKPELISLARAAAGRYQLDPRAFCGQVERESRWDPWAIRFEPGFLSKYISPLYVTGKLSPTEAYARSFSWGLLQMMGQTAREQGFDGDSLCQLCDPAVGLDVGGKFLAHLLMRAKGDLVPALQHYNGGSNPNYSAEVLALAEHYDH